MAAWRPQNRSKSKKALGVLPKGILTPSFIEIALAVTKRALLMDDDDDDGRHIIAIAHQSRVGRPTALKTNYTKNKTTLGELKREERLY
jgi:hypothetical protein